MTQRKPWSFAAGKKGRPFRVTVFENPQRDWTLALRWNVETDEGTKRKTESLEGRKLRTVDGKIVREIERWAKAQAQNKYESLLRGDAEREAEATAAAEAAAINAPLTIGETEAKLVDPARGKYPTPSQHRKETLNAVNLARVVWGSDRAWNTIRKGDIRALGRARIQQLRGREHTGLAGAEHTVQRVLTVAQWLRDEDLIEPGACVAPKTWKEELRGYWLETSSQAELPRPKRPRYTVEEALKIVDAAATVDPRLALMLWLAPNQRLGQVSRARRSNVDLKANEVKIPTKGKKRGAVIDMTPGERAVLDTVLTIGYLRELEGAYQRKEIDDYPLFPSGQLPGGRVLRRGFGSDPAKPASWRAPELPTATVDRHATATTIARETIGDWFALAEAKAGVEKLTGRGAYGVRRTFVDAGKDLKISRDGMTALGGWADPQMADRIYADEEQRAARREARDVRARIRNEGLNEPTENGLNPQQTSNSAPVTEGAVG
jgi:integrase